jgi:hypothetical protein
METSHEWFQDIDKFLGLDNIWDCEIHPYQLFKSRIKDFIIVEDQLYFKDES